MGSLSTIGAKRLYLDANLFVYTLEAVDPWFTITVEILSSIDVGHATAVTSELSLAECLVKPYQLGRSQVIEAYRDLLQSRSYFTVAPIDRDILIEAARLRGVVGLKLPDAIHTATALKHGCEVFLTNDQRIKSVPGLKKYELRDLVKSS